jgi:hypothetical protein
VPSSQSAWKSPWQEFLDVRNGLFPSSRPITDYTVDVFRIPNCDFRSPEYNELTDWYWRVRLGDIPINGGLTTGLNRGHTAAESAIHVFEWAEFKEHHYWDVETHSWCRRGELPPLE